MADSGKSQALELYLLHAELADRVSQRREGANRLYVSLLSSFLVALAALLRFGSGEIPTSVILLFAGIIGMGISFSWRVVIRSYQQLNTGKFKALEKLEERLEYQFFKHEWELLGQGKYEKLTDAEKRLPVIFFVLFLLFLPISLYMICNQ